MRCIKSIIISALSLLFSLGAMSFNVHASESRLRAYVTNFEGEKISVIDLLEQKEIAQITTGQKPHGVAIAPDGSDVFVTNEGDGTLSFIDPKEIRSLRQSKSVAIPSSSPFLRMVQHFTCL